jgi:peroxiredoxin
VGDCAPDFVLDDANGTAWRLYDHAGDVIVLDFSAMWCPHCQRLADDLQDIHARLAASGVSVATVLTEDTRSQPPDAQDLLAWTDAYDLTHPVLADPGARIEADFGGYYQPNVLVIGRDMVVRWRSTGGGAAAGVNAAVDAAL